MSYGADLLDGLRKAGAYAGKIVQGTKPWDLPIEQPTKFTLAINTRTAQRLGISIPLALEVLVDELIEHAFRLLRLSAGARLSGVGFAG
jgi:putative ABC transport system substrate-binding protein